MKLVRYGAAGAEKPGLIDAQGAVRDLSGFIDEVGGAVLGPASLERLRGIAPDSLPLAPPDSRIGPCLADIGKIIGVGMNYWDHLKQAGAKEPATPTLFMKPSSSICGPYDAIRIPSGSAETDWEVELGVVIGSRASNVTVDSALRHVAGYCLVNDVTEREWIRTSGQLLNGKCADTFTPIGPWLVTTDEIGNPQDLALWLDLNGERRQTGNSSDMIFSIGAIVSFVSRLMTLEPGDLIITGTPAGVGARSTPPRFLAAGDLVQLGSPQLGQQNSVMVAG